MLAYIKTGPFPGGSLTDVPKPKISDDDEILIRVAACGICGSDLHYIDWVAGSDAVLKKFPIILGHEASGVVEEIGAKVSKVAVGDHIVCDTWSGCGQCYWCRIGQYNFCQGRDRIGMERDGGMAEYIVMKENNVYKLAKHVDLVHASCLEPMGIVLHALERCDIKAGDRVLVLGPGTIGTMTSFFAHRASTNKVVITGLAADGYRLGIAERLGATPYTLTGENDMEELMELADNIGYDTVFETSGSPVALDMALSLVRPAGTIVLVGLGDGKITNNIAVRKEISLIGSYRRPPITWLRMLSMMNNKSVDVSPFITHTMPLSDIEKGISLMKERRALKVSLIP